VAANRRAGEVEMEQMKAGFMERPVRMRWLIRIVLALIIIGLIGYLVTLWHTHSLRNTAIVTVRDRIKAEGTALAQTISVTSRDDIAARRYDKLQQYFADLVKQDGVQYIAVIMPDGRAVVHTNAKDRGKVLDDDLSKKAADATDTLVQDVAAQKVYDVAVPVMGLTRKDATVRVGISYADTERLFR
jgi:sensor histidine kinase regulating citrate/malate metabolism